MREVKQTSTGKHKIPIYVVLLSLLLAVLLVSITLGRYSVSMGELLEIFYSKLLHLPQTWPDTTEIALFHIRIPRIVAAALAGGALAVAGAVYQGLFRNPMVSPDILGASAGAGFGAALAILLSFNTLWVHTFSFAFGIMAVMLAYGAAKVVSRATNMTFTLILTGMVISTMFSSFISIAKFVADPSDKLPSITFWLMGGLSSVLPDKLMLFIIPVVLCMIPIFILRWQLNIMAFGDEEAKALGVEVKRIRLVMIVCATLLTAGTVSIAGMIGWVGLIIPHVARQLTGPNYQTLLPTSVITGSIFMIIVDDLARSAFPVEIPLGILTSLIGGPFFIYLLYKGRRSSA